MHIDRSNDRATLLEFASSADARPTIRRDECGDWTLIGRRGHVVNGGRGRVAFYLVIAPTTTGLWNRTKHDLAFCQLTQDGDDEGILKLDRLPTLHEGNLIRKRLGLHKRRNLDPEQKRANADRLARFRFKSGEQRSPEAP